MCKECGVRDPENSSRADYDLSEAAFKELYRDLDDDHDPAGATSAPKPGLTPSQIVEARAGLRAVDDRAVAQKPNEGKTAPLVATGREVVRARVAPAPQGKRRRQMRPLAATAVVLVALVLVLASLAYDPIQARLSALFPERRPPKVTGALTVADLAAGHEIKPGETFVVNLPPGKVQIAVAGGEVALVTKVGATVRPCSKEPFEIEVKSDATATPPPLIAACGKEPASVAAVIPPPPLPSD
jgi:hypothetical protein